MAFGEVEALSERGGEGVDLGDEVGVGEGEAGGGVDEGRVGGERRREEGECEGREGEREGLGRERDERAEAVEALGFVAETGVRVDKRRRRKSGNGGQCHELEWVNGS